MKSIDNFKLEQRLRREYTKDVLDWWGQPHNGFALIKYKGKFNFIGSNTKILCKQWFDWAWDFQQQDNKRIARIKLNGKYNHIDSNGNYVSPIWYDDTTDFDNGIAEIKIVDKWFNIDTNGQIHNKV